MSEVDPFRSAVAGIRAPDSKLAREAVDLARDASGPMLFKRGFLELLRHEVAVKPPSHPWHPVTMVQHHCCGGVEIADARPMIDGAPFDD